jgi:hypothetical protein
MKSTPIIAVALLATCSLANAEGCQDYPFTQGINVEDVNGGTKIIATADVSVSFDDIDAIKDSRDEATIEAKSLISAFMSEGIHSDQVINKAVQETKSMQGDTKVAVRKEVVDRVKRLASSTQALLRGVVPLGECYTKGKEFRVSVGLKPDTISSAENAAGNISNSLANQPPPGAPMSGSGGSGSSTSAPSAPSATQPPSGVDSYSDTKRLNKF